MNDYLRETTGEDFTAKDFRTWHGTIVAFLALKQFEKPKTEREAKRNLTKAIQAVAQNLGNTPAVSRKCYIHPEVINAYTMGALGEPIPAKLRQELERNYRLLRPEEYEVMGLLFKNAEI